MPETIQTLGDLSTLKPVAAPEPPKYVQKLDKQGRAYATGKRKDAVARVWVKLGAGKILINDRPVETYFARPVLRMLISAAAGRSQSPGAIRRSLHRFRRWTVGPGRCGSSRPVEGVDASRARSAQCPQAWRLPDARLACCGAQEIRPRQSASQLPILQALAAARVRTLCASGCLPEQGLKASHRLGSKSGAVLLFLRLISGGDRQVKQVVDFVVFFVLFRNLFSFVARCIFSSFPPSFCKTCVFYQTDDKRMRCYA